MSFESNYHAAQLRQLRKSGADDELFLHGIKEELRATLSPVFLPTCNIVAKAIKSVGHRITPSDNLTNLDRLCIGYGCASPVPGELSALALELMITVVGIENDAEPLPMTPNTEEYIEIGSASRDALANLLGAGEKLREVERRIERAAEHIWLASLASTWKSFFDRLRSIGYNFQPCFLDEAALDVRDSELRVHVGLSAIVAATLVIV